jgi:hypothetical protein
VEGRQVVPNCDQFQLDRRVLRVCSIEHAALRGAKEGCNDLLWLICEKLKATVNKGISILKLAEHFPNPHCDAALIEDGQSFKIEMPFGEFSHVATREHEFSRANPFHLIPQS